MRGLDGWAPGKLGEKVALEVQPGGMVIVDRWQSLLTLSFLETRHIGS
jgi:hypothetical protein